MLTVMQAAAPSASQGVIFRTVRMPLLLFGSSS
jgi:hypothetical protein